MIEQITDLKTNEQFLIIVTIDARIEFKPLFLCLVLVM